MHAVEKTRGPSPSTKTLILGLFDFPLMGLVVTLSFAGERSGGTYGRSPARQSILNGGND